jgi:addiction module HigA family antidote
VIVSFADPATEALYNDPTDRRARRYPREIRRRTADRPPLSTAMLPKNRIPSHPGAILLEDFLRPLGVSQVAFAAHIGVPLQRVNEIVRGKRGVSSETAWLLAAALGTTPEFWSNLQTAHDLAASKPARRVPRLRSTGRANERARATSGRGLRA